MVIQMLKHYFTVLKKTKPKHLPDNFLRVLLRINLKFHDTFKELVDHALKSEKKGKQKTKDKKERKKEGKKNKRLPIDVDRLKSHLKKELKMAEASEDK